MALFISNHNDIVISANDKFIVYRVDSGKTLEVCIPELFMPPNLTVNQQNVLKNEKVIITTCAFSDCGDFFAVTTSTKQLVVYDKDFKLIKNLNLARSASKVRFTTNRDIIVADKTGDVYLYKLQSENVYLYMRYCEVVQVLGHLSMVLDALTVKSDEYIITSDRDEKIRVSHFPSGYNIVSFCLGHEEFVLALELYNSDILISASGDGTVRFWNYVCGKSLAVVNVNDYVEDKNLIKKFAEEMDNETVEVTALPITSMKVKTMDNFTIMICSLHCYNNLLVFKVTGAVNVNLLQMIEFDSNLVSFDLSNSLYVLTNTKIHCYDFRADLFVENNSNILSDLYGNLKDMIESCSVTENISVLYKRKFDNVQQYKERKKLRIDNKK